MCGIICYIGKQNSIPILMEGLKRLEYRGYDSAGLAAVNSKNKDFVFVKSVGKVNELEKKVKSQDGNCDYGIAHTRWATHGKPTEINAHPHTDCSGKLFIVHNGIIENYEILKSDLIEKGHKFVSDTDTEVLAHLIEENLDGSFEEAVRKALSLVEGTFGIAVIHKDFPRKIIVARRGSPIILGIGEDEYIAASDINAFIRYTNKVIYLNDNEMALLNDKNITITDLNLKEIAKEPETIEWDYTENEKSGFKHFMLKEIYEQPKTVENAIRGRLIEGEGISKLGGLEPVLDRILNLKRLTFVSCGTSFYAGLYGKYIFEMLTDLDVDVDYASEFRYRNLKLSEYDGVVAISQSGETADTLAALREAKRKGALVLGLVNVVGSTIAKETDAGVYCHAGPEIGVASTKIFVSQCVILNLIALLLGRRRGLSIFDGMNLIKEIKKLPENIKFVLDNGENIRGIAKKYLPFKNFLYIGRHLNFPIAMEGALKLKEISYVHAEGYPAGEMKHGPISLIDENFPTVAIATDGFTYEKMISNIQEIKARSGKVIAIATEGNKEIKEIVDDVIYVPKTIDILQPIINVIPLQLFAYYFADFKGRDIDKPRNLAKSVTVE
ncbi:glucosamine--fructose-6-phosphate aminotransferase [Thermotomaculum hydrothermale]|uniref:Glutamine--fructose-6-phosphate aminotransferase [isomerizing] n=1 Tax=Thermotomaculum hydrothermale TaxID=981385 RepID=A0A7R6PXB7_9BACT|nr:glutamine--fructose-6-phosphate transaminase (isomerizing) [Thermotomaculum hydrothermale]BBB32405.1 glucosamine--fructose-6-phosphate aminotransferase [Thermotomaculum hydrothermale]